MSDQTGSNKKSTKKIIAVIVMVIVFAAGVFGYFKVKKLQNQANRSAALKEELNEIKEMRTAIQKERRRCQKLVNKESGNFDEYTYCNTFLKWSSELSSVVSN